MTAREVAAIIEAWAPLSIQESWDNAGFCVGSPQTEVKGALFCLDVTPDVVQEALDLGVHMVISHHPLIFHGLKQICGEDAVTKMIIKALRHDLVLYSVHTNADKVATGVSGVMAEMLDLKNVAVLHPDTPPDAAAPVGLGVVGDLAAPQEVHTFLQRVKEVFNLSFLRVGPICMPAIARVAVCGGSGSSLISRAMACKADIFISGDISYHHFFSTEGKMMVADIGHYESEIGIIHRLASVVSEKSPNFAVYLTKHNTNPIHYL